MKQQILVVGNIPIGHTVIDKLKENYEIIQVQDVVQVQEQDPFSSNIVIPIKPAPMFNGISDHITSKSDLKRCKKGIHHRIKGVCIHCNRDDRQITERILK